MAEYKKPELNVDELSKALFNVSQQLNEANKKLLDSNEKLLESNEDLKLTNEKLIASEKVRNEMFANISHDLRSPITALKSSVEYLLDSRDLPQTEMDSVLHLMDVRINNLEELINDVFLMATLEAKSLVMNFEYVSAGTFLEEFFFNCEADNKYNEKELILNVPMDFNYSIYIDPKRFIRVLDNLFTNACKYSDRQASITLDACYTAELSKEQAGHFITNATGTVIMNPAYQTSKSSCGQNGFVDITVSDTGFGIAEQNLEKIFDRSFMVSSARTPGENQSYGLGLAITRSIVEQHDGAIWCESEYGKGSTFHIMLPVMK